MKYIILLYICMASFTAHAKDNAKDNTSQIYLNYQTATGSVPIKSWKNLRDNQIEKQDKDFSCGSAAVATILRFFYGKEIYEADILAEILEKTGVDDTASFADLEQAVKKFGFKAVGLTLNFEKLRQLKIPAIVYVYYRDNDHFSVLRGVNDEGVVWLGDPSWGNRKLSENQFNAMWETRDDNVLKGKILLIIPEDKSLAQLDDFFYPPTTNKTAIELLKANTPVVFASP